MTRLAANLSLLFNEVAFLDRFASAARAGFSGVEYLFPYEWPAQQLRRLLDDHGLAQVLFNAPPGDWAAGERGIAALPAREREFTDSIRRAADYADALSCPLVHVMAGIDGDESCYSNQIAWAVDHLREVGVGVTIEPLNRRDFPGYHLASTDHARRTCDQTGARLQFDVYHVQILEGDLLTRITEHAGVLGHVQIAGVPDRHEPDTGEVRTEVILDRIDALGYGGWIGCEYRPAGRTDDGLGWARAYGVRPA